MATKQWSFSQSDEIRRCERKWYLAHGRRAATNSRDPLLREIAFLKKLRPSWMWRGSLIHDLIATALMAARSGRSINQEQLLLYARRAATQQWEDSRRRAAELDPKSRTSPEGPILFEHYFPHALDSVKLDDVISEVTASLGRFLLWARDQQLLARLNGGARVWIDPKQPPSISVHGVNFLTKIDLAIQEGAFFDIVDWKTDKHPATT